jgi:6-phosphogluconolactonase
MTPDRARRLPQVRVLPTADAVAEVASADIAEGLALAIAERGVAHWATTGGSAAPGIYRHLRVPPLRDLVDWSRVHVWWGDDRFVPADDPLSNVLPFEELLLAADAGVPDRVPDGVPDDTADRRPGTDLGGVRIPKPNVHPVPVAEALAAGDGAAAAAAAYETALLLDGPARTADGTPVFDVIVVGVGPDGHVLSVFPGSAAWDEAGLVVAVPAPTHVEPHVDRVTMHPDILGAARSLLVVSAGSSKAAVLGRAWRGDDIRELPVRATMATNATWILDEAAATDLPRE